MIKQAALRDHIAETLQDHPWNTTSETPPEWRAHSRHKYSAECAICQGDTRSIASVAAAVAVVLVPFMKNEFVDDRGTSLTGALMSDRTRYRDHNGHVWEQADEKRVELVSPGDHPDVGMVVHRWIVERAMGPLETCTRQGDAPLDPIESAILETLAGMYPDVRPQGTGEALTLRDDARTLAAAVRRAQAEPCGNVMPPLTAGAAPVDCELPTGHTGVWHKRGETEWTPAQPPEEEEEDEPEEEWQFAVSPDERQVAIWDPGNQPWFIPESNPQGHRISATHMNRLGWTRYTPANPRSTP